ncbi:MAG: phosphoribosylformylglycinamidine synthase subunit PurS [Proteobacteria bacterium]|nr:phosphoribosylformylglycinamidine synthase subunit PurS [Pseudomonadota bacterium]
MMTAAVNPKPRGPVTAYRIEVALKHGFQDPAGASVLAQLPLLGVSTVNEVSVGHLYEIASAMSLAQAHQAAQGLLADPITQDFFVNNERRTNGASGPHWRIEVWLKASVSDPVGDSVRKALRDMGLPAAERVRCGTVYRLKGRLSQAQADKVAVRLLANPVVHQFSVTSA